MVSLFHFYHSDLPPRQVNLPQEGNVLMKLDKHFPSRVNVNEGSKAPHADRGGRGPSWGGSSQHRGGLTLKGWKLRQNTFWLGDLKHSLTRRWLTSGTTSSQSVDCSLVPTVTFKHHPHLLISLEGCKMNMKQQWWCPVRCMELTFNNEVTDH